MKTLIAMLLALSVLTIASFASVTDVDGTWKITLATQMGSNDSTLVLTQHGDAITGKHTGHFGEVPVTGAMDGNNVFLTYKLERQGTVFVVTYTATVDGRRMSGKFSIVGFGEGTLNGVRQ